MARKKAEAVEVIEDADLSEDQKEDNRRQYSRRSVLWPAKLTVGVHEFSCQVWNLSLGGARLRADIPLKNGTKVILDIPERGRLPGEIVWARNEALGVDFTIPKDRVRKMFEDRLHVLGLHEI